MISYSGALAIGREKYKDLQELCNAGLIPKVLHNYYKGLNNEEPIGEDDNEILPEDFFL
jgi:hypothetical protein